MRFGTTLALRELRATACAAEPVLLALLHAAVAGQEGVFAEFGQVLARLLQRPGDPQLAGIGLAGDAAAVDADHDIDQLALAGLHQRGQHRVLVRDAMKILVEGAAIAFAHTLLQPEGKGYLSDWSKRFKDVAAKNSFYAAFGRKARWNNLEALKSELI